MTKITVEFPSEQAAQRVMYLVHQDLCRVEGSIVLAEEKLNPNGKLYTTSGSQRSSAEQVLEAAPKHAEVLRASHEALRRGLARARRRGDVG